MTDTPALEALARRIAVEAHAGQVDQAGEPYFGHLQRVVDRLDDPLDRAVGWLHDVVEDTDWTLPDLYGQRDQTPDWRAWNEIVGEVDRLTHDRNTPRSDYYERIALSTRAVRVKLADVADNSDPEQLARLDDATRVRLTEKYRRARVALGAEVTA